MNNQTTHSAKMLKITVSFGWIDYTRQLWDLPYSVLCLQKEVFLNTFWQGCLTALNSPDMQCIIQNVENHCLLWLNWLHKTTLGLTIFSALLAKGGFFKHILARMFDCTKFPRHAMHHTKKLQFFFIVHQIRANMESRHWHRPTNNAGCLLLISPYMVAILWHHKPSNSTMNVLCC